MLCVEVLVECLVAMLGSDMQLLPYALETVLIVYTSVLLWGVGVLLTYQCYLLSTNKTTNEHIRRLYLKNPYNRGLFLNCASFWRSSPFSDSQDTAREVTQTLEIRT